MDEAHQVELGYKFRGTTDVAVINRSANQARELKVHQLLSLCKHVCSSQTYFALDLLCCLFLSNAAEWPSPVV